ncbi:MAG TPA: hypothetical protein VMY34_06540 [Acidimicrobiales bacterium]|nr:hypothetical protein [Acidimicrobiales bacterium]
MVWLALTTIGGGSRSSLTPGVPPWRKDGAGVYCPMVLWLGRRDAAGLAVRVKLTSSYEEAVHVGYAVSTTISGLGQWGWLTVALAGIDVALVRDWVEESYLKIAPRRFVAELDARRR